MHAVHIVGGQRLDRTSCGGTYVTNTPSSVTLLRGSGNLVGLAVDACIDARARIANDRENEQREQDIDRVSI
jgi:hypothetical protein